nr:phosphatase PAP2 family protein [Phaeobacter sp. HF9A]
MVPGLDLWTSGQFFDPALGGFYLEGSAGLQFLRQVIWNLFDLVALIALLFGVQALYTRHPLEIPGRFWGYCVTLVVLGPGLLVNALLKSHWGRARPAHIDVFGGDAHFTPALQYADQCVSNCSFVSGEASAATVGAIIAGLILWNVVPPQRRRLLVCAMVGFALLGASLRVFMGRHFLSDVIWAMILMLTLSVWLGRLFRIRAILPRVTCAALTRDARVFWLDVRGVLLRTSQQLRATNRRLRRLSGLAMGRMRGSQPKGDEPQSRPGGPQ